MKTKAIFYRMINQCKVFYFASFVLIQLLLAVQVNAQSAIHQLEEITGQKINTYSGGNNNYTPATIPPNYNAEYGEYITEEGNNQNQKGIKCYVNGKYKKALRHFKRAHKYLPDNASINSNIENAKNNLKTTQKVAVKKEARKKVTVKKEPKKKVTVKKEVRRQENKSVEKKQKEITRLRELVKQDQKAILNMGCNKRAEDFEDWEKLNVSTRDELKSKVMGLLIDAASMETDALSKFNKKRANKFLYGMEKKEIELPDFVKTFVDDVQKNNAKAGKANYVLDRLNLILTGKNIVSELSGKQWLELSQDLLKLGLKDPRLGLLVSEIDATTSLVYSQAVQNVSKRESDNLTTLTEDQLKELKVLSERMKKHVNELNKAKGELNNMQ